MYEGPSAEFRSGPQGGHCLLPSAAQQRQDLIQIKKRFDRTGQKTASFSKSSHHWQVDYIILDVNRCGVFLINVYKVKHALLPFDAECCHSTIITCDIIYLIAELIQNWLFEWTESPEEQKSSSTICSRAKLPLPMKITRGDRKLRTSR